MTHKLKQAEVLDLRVISDKIDKLQATKSDFINYEEILEKAGFSEEKIRSVMVDNGFNTYEEYIKGASSASTHEEKMIISATIKAFFVGLAVVVLIWVVKGVIEIEN